MRLSWKIYKNKNALIDEAQCLMRVMRRYELQEQSISQKDKREYLEKVLRIEAETDLR